MARKRPEYPAGLSDEAVDALIAEVKTPEQLDEVFRDLKRRLVERVLRAEVTQHLGYPESAGRRPGFDEKVLSLYARGLTVRELQAHLEECYQVPVSADVITRHGRRAAGGRRLAAAAARAGVHRRGLRRAAGEDPRRRAGAAQGGVSGAGRAAGRRQGGAGLLARADGGRRVLATRDGGVAGARRARTS